MGSIQLFRRFGLIAVLFLASSIASAYTAVDYYNAGLQFYNAQNYTQAVQYFTAALNMDPNNVGALQSRGNCYYQQGQLQSALTDYQKALALQPNNTQLASFVQTIQAKLVTSGSPAAAAPAAAPAAAAPVAAAVPVAAATPAASSAFSQGVALYQQKQYAQAIPQFQAAIQANPNDAASYKYLGYCQVMTGDYKDAAVALTLSNQKQPDPSIQNYLTQLKSRFAPADQQWVDSQVAAASSTKPAKTASKGSGFGIRLEPSIVSISLDDLVTHATSFQTAVSISQSSGYASDTYDAKIPTSTMQIALEPVISIGSNLEIGIPLSYLPVGKFTESYIYQGVAGSDSFDISAFSVGLNLRYLFGEGDIRPFIGAGGFVMPMSMDYSSTPSNAMAGTYSSMGAGGQGQAGVDFRLGENAGISAYGGYETASADSFKNGSLSLQMVTIAANETFIGASSTTTANSRPFKLNLSGPFGGIMIAGFF